MSRYNEVAALVMRHQTELQSLKDGPASFDRIVDMTARHYEEMRELALRPQYPDSEADGVVFCGKCGGMKI